MASYKIILIVDPDPESRNTVGNALLLEQKKYTVLFAADGRSAIEIMDSQHIHLVITELALPGADGLEVLDYARQTCPPVPAIVVTNHLETFEGVARSLGALSFFSKPFSSEELLNTVKQIFRFKTVTQNIGLTLISILQATASENGDYILVVASENEKGKFFFQKGNLFHAVCGEKMGEEAVSHMLAWRICSYKHFPLGRDGELPRKTIFKDIMYLLMDYVVHYDERPMINP
jgi:two-component system, chemotaxis family, chemotaxis protein CheY